MSGSSLTYKTLSSADYRKLNQSLNNKDAMGIIKWAYQQFNERMTYACSFGAEAIVMLDMISKVKPDADIVFLDTHFHFKETYELIDRIQEKYPNLNITIQQPSLTASEQAKKHGDKLWERNPDLCCHIRKVLPLQEKINTVDAWFSGLRRDQSPARANTEFVNKDDKFKSIKICPLIHWTWDDIWLYIDTFELPFNPLHKEGYPSIGCEYCTFKVNDTRHTRAGRWKGRDKTECGLHSNFSPDDKQHDD